MELIGCEQQSLKFRGRVQFSTEPRPLDLSSLRQFERLKRWDKCQLRSTLPLRFFLSFPLLSCLFSLTDVFFSLSSSLDSSHRPNQRFWSHCSLLTQTLCVFASEFPSDHSWWFSLILVRFGWPTSAEKTDVSPRWLQITAPSPCQCYHYTLKFTFKLLLSYFKWAKIFAEETSYRYLVRFKNCRNIQFVFIFV